MTTPPEGRLRVLLPDGQVFEAAGEGIVGLGGCVSERVDLALRKDRGGLCTLDLRTAGVGTLLSVEAATRGPRVTARAAAAQLGALLAGQPRCAPRPPASIDDAALLDIARALARGPGVARELRETWLGDPEVARALARRVLADPRPGDALAIVRLLPLDERGAAWVAIASDPREDVRHSLFEMLAPRYGFPGLLPLEMTPEDATRLLSRGVADASGRVRAQAIAWARATGHVQHIAEAVKRGVDDPDPDCRQQCLRTLGEVGDDEARGLARAAIGRADEADAAAAIVSLTTVDDAEGIARACLDPRRSVRLAAAHALSKSATVTSEHLQRLSPPSEEVKFAAEVCAWKLRKP
jgi:hypothetical protein